VELVVATEEHRVDEDAAPTLVDEGGAQDLRDLLKLHDEDELAAGRRATTVSLAAAPVEPDAAAEEEDQAEPDATDGQAMEHRRRFYGHDAQRGGLRATQTRSGGWSSR
jgi:hypothetical protein